MYMKRVTSVISSHDPTKGPLFFYYAMQTCHGPEQAPDSFVEPYLKNKEILVPEYYGMVSFVDEAVHNLTSLMRARGLWDSTFMVLQSDNGAPPSSGTAWPLRGSKFSDWEGGVRTVAFVAGGLVPASAAGTVRNGYVFIADWYLLRPTFLSCHLADPQ